MQRTNIKTFLVIFSACLVSAAPSVVPQVDSDRNSGSFQNFFHNESRIVHMSDITTSSDEKNESLITYQPIIHISNSMLDEEVKKISDEYSEIFEITSIAFRDVIFLISTLSEDSCEENSSLPTWKINTREDGEKFLVRVNHAGDLIGKSFFLCVFDEDLRKFQHLGESSRFQLSG